MLAQVMTQSTIILLGSPFGINDTLNTSVHSHISGGVSSYGTTAVIAVHALVGK